MSVRWEATLIELEALLPRLRDSAPGPDGVPYSAWSATSSTTIHYLWQAYKALLAGDTPPVEFLASLMVFLPTGAEDSDNEEIERSADATRPLNLSNTDAKIITKLIERPLGQVAQAMVVRSQFGFVKHRRLQDAIITLESHALSYSMTAPATAGVLLLDQKTAFPSISHDFIF